MAKTVIHCEVCHNSTEILPDQKVFVCPFCKGVFTLNQKQERENG